MKKTISILLVVLLASACLFADVSLTGELGFGYKVKFDGSVENKDYLNLDSTYGGRFKIKLGSDYVNGELRMDAMTLDQDGKITTGVRQPINGYATVKASKLVADVFEVSLPVGVELYVGNQSFSSSNNWAYLDPQGNEKKISLNASRSSMPIGVAVSYDKYVTAKAWGSIVDGDRKGLLEAQVAPIDGVKAMIAYGLNQPDGKDNFQAAALVDVKTLANLDFSLAASAQVIANTKDFAKASYFAAVKGGYENIGSYVEYINAAGVNNLYAGASYSISSDKAPTTLSAGVGITNDFSKVGASIGADTQIKNIELNVKLGCDDFSDFAKNGYVRFASYITF